MLLAKYGRQVNLRSAEFKVSVGHLDGEEDYSPGGMELESKKNLHCPYRLKVVEVIDEI